MAQTVFVGVGGVPSSPVLLFDKISHTTLHSLFQEAQLSHFALVFHPGEAEEVGQSFGRLNLGYSTKLKQNYLVSCCYQIFPARKSTWTQT